jgi:hypothetical protein
MPAMDEPHLPAPAHNHENRHLPRVEQFTFLTIQSQDAPVGIRKACERKAVFCQYRAKASAISGPTTSTAVSRYPNSV